MSKRKKAGIALLVASVLLFVAFGIICDITDEKPSVFLEDLQGFLAISFLVCLIYGIKLVRKPKPPKLKVPEAAFNSTDVINAKTKRERKGACVSYFGNCACFHQA